jgi:serine/threonine-protein kinase
MFFKAATPDLPRRFRGKWNRNVYRVERELGRGANGAVYLTTQGGERRAVKVGSEGMDILMEVHILKSLQQGRDSQVGPLLCDVDDLVLSGGQTCTFYAMEYLDGEQLDVYVKQAGKDWVPVLIVQLLARLDTLHRHGWVFGDLKPENVMVTRRDKQIRLIDFGGVTKLGNAVRQFTEEYDRAYWHAGDRRSEIGYDLFSAAVMMVRLMADDQAWQTAVREPRQTLFLCDIIRKSDGLYPYRVPLIKAFHGKYRTAAEMRTEMLAILRASTAVPAAAAAATPGSNAGTGSGSKWIDSLFVASMLLLAGTLYYAWFL